MPKRGKVAVIILSPPAHKTPHRLSETTVPPGPQTHRHPPWPQRGGAVARRAGPGPAARQRGSGPAGPAPRRSGDPSRRAAATLAERFPGILGILGFLGFLGIHGNLGFLGILGILELL